MNKTALKRANVISNKLHNLEMKAQQLGAILNTQGYSQGNCSCEEEETIINIQVGNIYTSLPTDEFKTLIHSELDKINGQILILKKEFEEL